MTDWITASRNAKKTGELPPLDSYPPGVKVTVLENGVRLIEGKLGRLYVKGERPKNAIPLTKETSAIVRAKQLANAQARAAEGLMEAVNEANERLAKGGNVVFTDVPTEAFKYIIKHAAEVYLNSTSPKGMSDLGAFISRAAGMVREQGERLAEENGLPLAGLDDAKNIIQVFNFYNTEYQSLKEQEQDFVDVEAR